MVLRGGIVKISASVFIVVDDRVGLKPTCDKKNELYVNKKSSIKC
jgi:hypothetical protein